MAEGYKEAKSKFAYVNTFLITIGNNYTLNAT